MAEYARQALIANIQLELANVTSATDPADQNALVANAIQRGYTRTDRDLLGHVRAAFKLGFGAVGRCGSCALLAFLHGDTLSVANGA